MAQINSRTLFLTTSPRTPEKMVPEIELLVSHFQGQSWDKTTQCAFMEVLREAQFFNGKGDNAPAFSARDRINRAPKSLGFITLSPHIALTPAGLTLLTSKRKEEVWLRQMLKFQVPSPYHKTSEKAAAFCVRPYLEMLRLVRTLGTLKFDELQLFGMQLTDWHQFDTIVKKIEHFRTQKAAHQGSYKQFKTKWIRKELSVIFKNRIEGGELHTRESEDNSLEKFLHTQSNNMRDYADACFRYLRATGLVNVSHVGKSLSIVPERIEDVDFLLATIDRDPCFVNDESRYQAYLGNAELPRLLTDDKQRVIEKLKKEFPFATVAPNESISNLKELLATLTEQRKENAIDKQVVEMKSKLHYDDIQNTFSLITNHKDLYDAPLMLEWNIWRAMTMLDGGRIKANLNFDDFGKPLSTAPGNMADIVCDYGDFLLSVEVTMTNGQRQYETESEPVSRHLGKLKKESGKTCYCLFLAPKINEASIAHFFTLQHTSISFYGGKSVIVPLPLTVFQKMLEDSYRANYIPNPKQVKRFFEKSKEIAMACDNETDWYEQTKEKALDWLT